MGYAITYFELGCQLVVGTGAVFYPRIDWRATKKCYYYLFFTFSFADQIYRLYDRFMSLSS